MKRGLSNATALALLAVGITIAACQKEDTPEVCNTYTELTGTKQQVDTSILSAYPAFADTLAKYPGLEILGTRDDNYSITINCELHYQGILVFNSYYSLYVTKATNQIKAKGIPSIDTIPISLTPTITATQALEVARQSSFFDTICPYYRLVLFDINQLDLNDSTEDYRLAWKVQGADGLPFVLVDAHTQKVHMKYYPYIY